MARPGLPEEPVSPVGRRRGHACLAPWSLLGQVRQRCGTGWRDWTRIHRVLPPGFCPYAWLCRLWQSPLPLMGTCFAPQQKGALRAGFGIGACRPLPFTSPSTILAGLLRAALELLPAGLCLCCPAQHPSGDKGPARPWGWLGAPR